MEGHVISLLNPIYDISYLDRNIFDILKTNEQMQILSINDVDPFDYIQNFNGEFRKLKSHQANFVRNQNYIILLPITSFPFTIDKLSYIKITFCEDVSVYLDYNVLHNDDKDKILNEYFDVSKSSINNISYYQFIKLKKFFLINFRRKH